MIEPVTFVRYEDVQGQTVAVFTSFRNNWLMNYRDLARRIAIYEEEGLDASVSEKVLAEWPKGKLAN
jgi:hypothetical protein